MSLLTDEEINIEPEKIAKDGLTELDDKYQKTVGFFAWDYFLATGIILKTIWEKIVYVAQCMINPYNMDYDDLCEFVYNRRNIVPKKETFAKGLLKVTNGSGTIKAGDIFETSSGVQYAALTNQTVAQNDTFEVQCLTAGTVGNTAVNTITVIPTTIQGIVEVTNPEAISNGYEKESKESVWQRYLDDVQKPITSNNKYHYRKWALEVAGVGDAKVKPLWLGDDTNSVKVVIIDSNFNVPSADLIAAVQEYIDPNAAGLGEGQASIGCYCTVAGATAKTLNLAFTKIYISSDTDSVTVLTNIQKSINDYLKSVVFDENVTYIPYNKIHSLVMTSQGVLDFEGFTINGGTSNISLTDNNLTTEIAVLGTITVTAYE